MTYAHIANADDADLIILAHDYLAEHCPDIEVRDVTYDCEVLALHFDSPHVALDSEGEYIRERLHDINEAM